MKLLLQNLEEKNTKLAKERFNERIKVYSQENNIEEKRINALTTILGLTERIANEQIQNDSLNRQLNDSSYQNIPANKGKLANKDLNVEFDRIAKNKEKSDEKLLGDKQEREKIIQSLISSEVESIVEQRGIKSKKDDLIERLTAASTASSETLTP